MGYQSEAELENKLIEKLKTQGYKRVLINDYSELENNFREQLNKFNEKALNNNPLTDKEFDRILNILNGKSVLQSAIKLREKVDFDRDDGTKIYLKKEVKIALVGKIPIALIDKQTNEFCLINHFITKEMETKTPYGLLDYLENKYKIIKDDIINQIINVENHG